METVPRISSTMMPGHQHCSETHTYTHTNTHSHTLSGLFLLQYSAGHTGSAPDIDRRSHEHKEEKENKRL